MEAGTHLGRDGQVVVRVDGEHVVVGPDDHVGRNLVREEGGEGDADVPVGELEVDVGALAGAADEGGLAVERARGRHAGWVLWLRLCGCGGRDGE